MQMWWEDRERAATQHTAATSQPFEVIFTLTCSHITWVAVFPFSLIFGFLILLPRKTACVCHLPYSCVTSQISSDSYVSFQCERENWHLPFLFASHLENTGLSFPASRQLKGAQGGSAAVAADSHREESRVSFCWYRLLLIEVHQGPQLRDTAPKRWRCCTWMVLEPVLMGPRRLCGDTSSRD